MMKNRSTALLAIAGALTLTLTTALTGTGEASAATSRGIQERSAAIVATLDTADSVPAEPVGEGRVRTQLLAAADEYDETIAGTRLDSARREVSAVGSGYLVRTPLVGPGLDALSSRSVLFDSPTQVAGTVDYEFRGDGHGGGSLLVRHDGEVVWSQSITAGEAEAAVAGAQNEVHGAGNFWNRLNSCLANQGVASWMLALIAGACGAVCFFTAGLGCVVCIAALIAFPSGVIGGCVAYANK